MPATWPAFLQDKVNQAGFGYEPGKNVLRSETDTGPAKLRALTTKRVDKFSVSIDLEISQFSDWDNFYTVSLSSGVTPFYYNHPFTQVPSIFRMDAVKIDPMGGLYFKITMSWELLP